MRAFQGKVVNVMREKVAIIGCGNVGGTTAFSLAYRGRADLVLIESPEREGVAKAKALDIHQSCSLMESSIEVTGTSDWSALEGADLCIITAGMPRGPGMSREDLLSANSSIMRQVSYELKRHAPDCIVIVVTNPLDVMAYQVCLHTGFDPKQVMGMAGLLDTARFRTFVASEVGCSVKSVQALVLGGHGDSMVPVVSHCSVSGIPITQLLSNSQISRIVHRTRKGGEEIVSLMGTSAYYAAAQCLAEMVDAVLGDSKNLITASAFVEGQYGIDGLFVGMPVIVGRRGVEKVVEIELDDKEHGALLKSASLVKESVEKAAQMATEKDPDNRNPNLIVR
ncbi:MAG: malate dehydrogenase [Chitinispirillaceae bacterium]